MSDRRALVLRFAALPEEQRWQAVMALSGPVRRELLEDWSGWAEAGQLAPAGDWRVWMLHAGRGFGKTRTGAEWVTALAREAPELRIALVAATVAEGRRVMVEGESGLLAVAGRYETVHWRRDTGEFTFASGAKAYLFSAEVPDTLRGPQHHYAWCDELAKWRYGEAAWTNLQFTLRLGDRPQTVVTTTPLPVPLVRKVMALPDCVRTRGSSRDNRYLPEAHVQAMEADYAGTALGRQELDGELIEDREGALWTRALLAECLHEGEPPGFVRMVVAVDPPASSGGDACGIVAVGLDADGIAWVVEDASVGGATPAGWAAAVAGCAARHGADRVVAEANQGGDMVGEVLRGADAALPVRLVHASRGKVARAEPVAHLYERGRVRHLRGLGALEDELCGMVVGGVYAGPGRSPDRADALVWAVTELCLRGRRGAAGVRAL